MSEHGEHRDAPAAIQALHKGTEVRDVSLAGILEYSPVQQP